MDKYILVVEDDNEFRNLLQKVLIKNNYYVETAVNGFDAIKKLDSVIPSLIITDILMPESDGLELIIQLKKKTPEIKIIAISGGGRVNSNNYLDIASLLKADATLKKPFKNELLLKTIKTLLDKEETIENIKKGEKYV